MIRRPKLWVVVVAVMVALAGFAVYRVLVGREQVTENQAVQQCQALDHLIQIQQYLVSTNTRQNDREKQLRISIFENFRDEQAREVSPECLDPLDPDVIVQAVREAEGG